MTTSHSYRELEVWQAGMTVVERLYTVTSRFPSEERFGLTAQLRRAVVSMPSNVAEGRARRSIRTCANHVSIALGSHAEVETYLEIARRLGFVKQQEFDELMPTLNSAGRPSERALSVVGRALARMNPEASTQYLVPST
jgi:four helix bundle protein